MDLQTHPTTKFPYNFFDLGLQYFDEENPPELTWEHQFTVVNHANYLQDNPGCRILVTGALPPEAGTSDKKARELVIQQIDYINAFAAEHSEKFVVARTPAEVRKYFHETKKTIIIHSIEGGKKVLDSAEDALFWAKKGVAFITLVHLIDDQFGGSAIRPGLATSLINFKGTLKKGFMPGKSRGLTEKGKQAILWLANAGIMTDITHMSDETRKDAIAFMAEHKLPPLVTHDMFKPIQNSPRGVPEEDVIAIYQNKGMMSLPISGISLEAYKPYPEYAEKLANLEQYCSGSIDSYKFTYEELKAFILENADHIFKQEGIDVSNLTEAQKIDLSIGFQSDFDGWLDHSRPRYGEEGCYEMDEGKDYEAIELLGLAHPGLLESQWILLEKENVDLMPVKMASEKFLQMWEYFLENKGSF